MRRPTLKTYLDYVGANVRRRRISLGLTQAGLGEETGFDTRYIQRIEAGAISMELDTLLRLATGLGVGPGTLLRKTKRAVRRHGRPRGATTQRTRVGR